MTRHTKTELATTGPSRLRLGSTLMAISGLAFVGYGVVFFIRDVAGSGLELGVDTLNGITRSELSAMEPAVTHSARPCGMRAGWRRSHQTPPGWST